MATINIGFFSGEGWSAGISLLLLFYIGGEYLERLIYLDHCLKDGARSQDIRNAQRVILVNFLWCVVCFFVLGALLHLGFLVCAAIFAAGWGIIHLLFGKRYMDKVEDPEKRRYYLWSLLFPKDRK